MSLTDAHVRAAKPATKPYKLTDSAGLYLEVRMSGAKLWRYRYRIAGKENVFAIGEYPGVGLADARAERDNARKLVKTGVHPAHNRSALKAANIVDGANTFEALAREWIEKMKARWTPYYLKQVEGFLKADVYPAIGRLPIKSVSAAQLLEIVQRIEKRAPSVAILVRQWCSAVFRYATATRRADGDPTVALKGAIHRPKVQHRKPLTDIPNFLKALDDSGGLRATKIAMRLLLLTFVRPVELRAAPWQEFNLDKAEWRIPPERMKMREEHVVPLSTQAVQLLRELHTLNGHSPLLFPNTRRPKECMTGTTLNRVLERMGYQGKFSSHGFRATASTMLNEMGFNPDWIERQLAHKERNAVRDSYNRAQWFAERRSMMQAWADRIDSLVEGNNVTAIRHKAA